MFKRSEIEVLKCAVENDVDVRITSENDSMISYYNGIGITEIYTPEYELRANKISFDFIRHIVYLSYGDYYVGYFVFEDE